VTITPRVLAGAHVVLFLVSGRAKAEIMSQTLYPPWENRHPAARVKLSHGEIEWFVDSDAAVKINPGDFH